MNIEPGFIALPHSFFPGFIGYSLFLSLSTAFNQFHTCHPGEKANKNFECLSLIYRPTRTHIGLSKHMSFMPKKDALWYFKIREMCIKCKVRWKSGNRSIGMKYARKYTLFERKRGGERNATLNLKKYYT